MSELNGYQRKKKNIYLREKEAAIKKRLIRKELRKEMYEGEDRVTDTPFFFFRNDPSRPS